MSLHTSVKSSHWILGFRQFDLAQFLGRPMSVLVSTYLLYVFMSQGEQGELGAFGSKGEKVSFIVLLH